MKKNFVKKLALAMALTLAVGSVPSMNVEAAAAPAFKSTKVNLKVGQTKKYNTVNSTKKSVKFVIGNKKIATVDYKKGNKYCHITGVAAGKTRVRAEFKDYKTKKVTINKMPVEVKEVVVEAELASVKQTAANAFEATFTADASKKFTAESFTSIASADGIYTTTVKSVEFSADGKTAKVTTYGNFADKTVFNVTCGEKTVQFTASVGAVKNIVIPTTVAQQGVETPIKFALYDENGIDVTSVISLNTRVIVDVVGNYASADTTKASEATITMDAVGDKATVTVIYDALDGTGEVRAEQTITCVEAQAVVATEQLFTLGGADVPKFYLNSFKASTTVYMDAPKTGYFVALDKKGDAIPYDTYEIESSNDTVFVVSDNHITGKYTSFNVTPVAPGTAQVIIKATKNDKSYTYAKTITVKAARVATSISLSNSSVSLSNSADTNYGSGLEAHVLDQYGNVMWGESAGITAEVVTEKDNPISVSNADGHCWVGVTAHDAAKGSYVVKLTGSDNYGNEVSKKFTVSVKDIPTGTATYKVELAGNSVDLNPENICHLNELGTTVRLAKYVGGVFDSYVAGADDNTGATVTIKKGTTTYGSDLTTTGSSITLTASGVAISAVATGKTASGDQTIDQKSDIAQTGTYTITVEYTLKGDKVKKSATFRVNNTQELPTVNVLSSTAETFGDIHEKYLTTDVSMLEEIGNEAVGNLYYYSTAAQTYTLVNDFDANNKATVNRIAVTDTFATNDGDVTFTYYVPVTRTFRAE